MPRVQPKFISRKERDELLGELWTMVAVLERPEEAAHFFRDLLGETEALRLARRIRIAKLLLEGYGYEEISKRLRTSPLTIASVRRWLQRSFAGYEKIVPKLQQDLAMKEELRRRKYPLHYLLVHLINRNRMPLSKKLRQ